MKQTRRLKAALEKDAIARLARFERVEDWEGLSPGDRVRVTGHRGTWHFRAFVTNTTNGATWVEVAEVMAKGRHANRKPARPSDPEAELPDAPADAGTVAGATRTRSFRPELVVPVKRSRRLRRPAVAAPEPPGPRPELPVPGPSVQTSLFEYLEG